MSNLYIKKKLTDFISSIGSFKKCCMEFQQGSGHLRYYKFFFHAPKQSMKNKIGFKPFKYHGFCNPEL